MQTKALATSQATSDADLINLWLHGKSLKTQRAYRADIARFQEYIGNVPLGLVTLRHLQEFADDLAAGSLAAASQARTLAAVKSLLSFAHKLGYTTFNVGAALELPAREDRLAERILSEADMFRILQGESDPRRLLILKMLYYLGLRAAELASLKWRHCTPEGNTGKLAVYGKGNRTRWIQLPQWLWIELMSTQPDNLNTETPIFPSRGIWDNQLNDWRNKGGHVDPSEVWRIVKRATRRVGLAAPSPHWFRHAHASHAMDRGADVREVQATLGHANLATTGRYLHVKPGKSTGDYLASPH